MPKTGAERLVESLIDADVKHLFTLSGNQILPVYDATIGRDIQLIHTRHEAAAVSAVGRMASRRSISAIVSSASLRELVISAAGEL